MIFRFFFFFRFLRVTKKWILETCIASFHCISLSTRAPVKAKKETKKKTATVLFFLPLNDILGKTSKIRRNSHKTSQEGNNLCSKATQASNRLAALGSSHASIFYSFSIMFQSYKWWEAPPLPEGQEWIHLEHAGVIFPPSYVPHHVPLVYDGKPITLTPEQEELATFYATVRRKIVFYYKINN